MEWGVEADEPAREIIHLGVEISTKNAEIRTTSSEADQLRGLESLHDPVSPVLIIYVIIFCMKL